MLKPYSTNIFGSETLQSLVSAAQSPLEPEKWVVRMTVDITDQSGQHLTSASTKQMLTRNESNATDGEQGALLITALGSLAASVSKLSKDWNQITDTTSGK